jgi:hypothetical protein
MSDNVVDIDSNKRLTKEVLKQIQETVKELTIDDLDSLLLFTCSKDGKIKAEAYGIGWTILGSSQAYLEFLRSCLLDRGEEIGFDD